jgi:hypothetical protein
MEQTKEDATVAPQFVQALDKITTTLAKALEQNAMALESVGKAVGADRVAELTTSDGRKLRAVSTEGHHALRSHTTTAGGTTNRIKFPYGYDGTGGGLTGQNRIH